jgi:ribosomal protein S18 acetylase RimI-like enzyme
VSLLRLTNKPEPRKPHYPDAAVPLTFADIPALRLSNRSLVRDDEVVASLRTMPGISQWHPASGEFVLVAPWRNRSDIATSRMISAIANERELVSAALDAADVSGMAAFITTETYERRKPEFYASHGLERLETIITYQHERIADFLDIAIKPAQEFRPVQPGDDDLIDGMVALDHGAFPWLWRNSPEEFAWWMQQQLVEVTVGLINGVVTSYYGTTHFRNMGHLDRIAIHPDYQGRALGRETLTIALQRMARLGHTRAVLCTQATNAVSQRLYERAGFRRVPNDDYHMYGKLLSAAPEEAHP